MNITEINRRLIGPIVSQGETNHDNEVIKNLQTVRELLFFYVDKLCDNAKFPDSHYGSVKDIALESHEILKDLKEQIDDSIQDTKQKIYKSDYHSPKFRQINALPKIFVVADTDTIISPFDINYTLEWYQHNFDNSMGIDDIKELPLFKTTIEPTKINELHKLYQDDDDRISFWDNATPEEIKALGSNMLLQPSTSKVGTIMNHYGDIYTKRTFYDILEKYKDINEPEILCSKEF